MQTSPVVTSCHHRRTQDFTMEGVHVVGVWGTKSPRSWSKMWN